MLNRIGDVDFVALDPGLIEAAIQKPARRPNKRATVNIFTVAGLLAHHHERRCTAGAPGCVFPFAKDGLSCSTIEIAAMTPLNGNPQAGK